MLQTAYRSTSMTLTSLVFGRGLRLPTDTTLTPLHLGFHLMQMVGGGVIHVRLLQVALRILLAGCSSQRSLQMMGSGTGLQGFVRFIPTRPMAVSCWPA